MVLSGFSQVKVKERIEPTLKQKRYLKVAGDLTFYEIPSPAKGLTT